MAQAEERADGVEEPAHARRRRAVDRPLELALESGELGSAGATATGGSSGAHSMPAAHRWASAARYGLRMAASPPGSGT